MKKLLILLLVLGLLPSGLATTTIINTVDDTYDAEIQYKDGVFNRVATDKIRVGTEKAVWYNSFLQFDTSAIPDDATIDSAVLTVYTTNYLSDGVVCNINVESIGDWYPIDATDWALTGTLIDSSPITSYQKDMYYNYNVAAYVDVTGTTNFKFSASQYTSPNNCEIELSDSAATKVKLTVTYTTPVTYVEDPAIVNIDQVYYSEQILQGSTTEIFAIITTNGTEPVVTVDLALPSGRARTLYFEPTRNTNEYRAFITDTYDVGVAQFSIKAQVGNYISEYGNQYVVAAYNVDFVETVNSVAVCQKVTEVERPPPELALRGTEYRVGDAATVFLQLLNGQGQPVSNADCHLNIYTPLTVNATHDYYIEDAPMMFDGNDDGIYYYDLVVPNMTGVFMLSAKCSYEFGGAFVYEMVPSETESSTRTSITGTFTGTTLVLNEYDDFGYTSCQSAGGGTKLCDAYYDFDALIHFTNSSLQNVTNINLYYMGEASTSAMTTFYFWNWTDSTWITLPNMLTYSGLASGGPIGVPNYASNSLHPDGISSSGIIRVRVQSSSGTNFQVYHNWLNIKLLTAQGSVQYLKGSSEMHVNGWFDYLEKEMPLVPNNVWNYNNRTLTGFEFDVVNETLIAEYVWNYTNRTLTYYYELTAQQIWEYLNRTLTYYPTPNNLTAQEVWEYNSRNLTYYEQVDNTDYQLLATYVWNNTERNLTYFPTQLTAQQVWEYTQRNLTYYPEVSNLTAEDVWTFSSRNLTYTPPYPTPNNLTAFDVWNYTVRDLTYYYELTPQQVWEYLNRTLTDTEDVTDYDLLSLYVWNNTNRTLTYYPTPLTAGEVWAYSVRNLTYYPIQEDLTNYTLITQNIWSYVTRNLTYYPDASVSTADKQEISEYTWNYTGRYTHGEII